jgi:hypothetical protein
MFLVCLIVLGLVCIVVWTAIDAPNASTLPPPHKRREHWG